jgi:hypothetical protein
MANSTVITAAAAIPDLLEIVAALGTQLQELCDQVQAFRRQPPTPERTCAFEKKRPRFSARPAACC